MGRRSRARLPARTPPAPPCSAAARRAWQMGQGRRPAHRQAPRQPLYAEERSPCRHSENHAAARAHCQRLRATKPLARSAGEICKSQCTSMHWATPLARCERTCRCQRRGRRRAGLRPRRGRQTLRHRARAVQGSARSSARCGGARAAASWPDPRSARGRARGRARCGSAPQGQGCRWWLQTAAAGPEGAQRCKASARAPEASRRCRAHPCQALHQSAAKAVIERVRRTSRACAAISDASASCPPTAASDTEAVSPEHALGQWPTRDST